MAFKQSAELQDKNTKLAKQLAKLEKAKKDLELNLEEVKKALASQQKEVNKRDKIIADKDALIKKQDASSELAKALQQKKAEVGELSTLLQQEQEKFLTIKEEFEMHKKQCDEELQRANGETSEGFVDVRISEVNVVDQSTGTITEFSDKEVPVPIDTDKQFDPVLPESKNDSMTVCQLSQELKEKEAQLTRLQNQIKDFQGVALEAAQVKDHSKTQSKEMLRVKQELDATKVSMFLCQNAI